MGWRSDGEPYCTVDECGLRVLHEPAPEPQTSVDTETETTD